MKARVYTHRTSHYDIIPTLMVRLFNNHSPVVSYSLGQDLLNPAQRSIIVGGYFNLGLLDQKSIVQIESDSSYTYTDFDLNKLADAQLSVSSIHKAFTDMMRFYQH
jgi:membrane-anchored protein YejM (alkaline phosphatase superfamily)